ncbi:cyclase family protein [Maribacter algarum]|uniref:Cyclase family protein n=1 Tax=Maribacter algarum (ex Zhang et al. 2020) TaxID=2578118 RepID=A0A5S3Q5N6_9FLAO|nr:cyclase family protein [Maribacter algarum]TMM52022.1 cyclase family protein [Maribacter algarum]
MIDKKVIDLTLPINEDVAGVSIEQAKTLSEDGWNATTLHLYSHSGTHMDAPLHFEINNQTMDTIPVNRLISEAWVIDLTLTQPSESITISHLQAIENKIQKGQSILLHTGWSKRLGTDMYRNELPRISSELAHWLGEKGVNMLGVEPPSVADVNNLEEVTEIHTILMQNDIVIIEGLTNLEEISKEKVTLVALPLKIENGDGAPARVIALE